MVTITGMSFSNRKTVGKSIPSFVSAKKLNFDLIIPFFVKKMSNLQKIVEAQLTRFYYFVDAIVCLKALLTFCQRRFLINGSVFKISINF